MLGRNDRTGSPDRLDRGAEHLAGMIERAGLHDHRERIDAVFGQSRGRHAEGMLGTVPFAQPQPAADHVVIDDGVPAVLAATDRNRNCLGEFAQPDFAAGGRVGTGRDRKSTRLNSSHMSISYAVFCLKKKKKKYYKLKDKKKKTKNKNKK